MPSTSWFPCELIFPVSSRAQCPKQVCSTVLRGPATPFFLLLLVFGKGLMSAATSFPVSSLTSSLLPCRPIRSSPPEPNILTNKAECHFLNTACQTPLSRSNKESGD